MHTSIAAGSGETSAIHLNARLLADCTPESTRPHTYARKRRKAVEMSDLIELLSRFNRKERFYLIGQALGNREFSLSEGFRGKLIDGPNGVGIEIPRDAFVAMDYHLDWIAASLFSCFKADATNARVFCNRNKVVTGTQQDIDLLIAFKAGETYHLILLEAKGYSPWDNRQMREKAERLEKIFGPDGKEYQPKVKPYFFLMSSSLPERLEEDEWPSWIRGHWRKLTLEYPKLKVTRCDSSGKSLATGDHFLIEDVQRPSKRGNPVVRHGRLTRETFLDRFSGEDARNSAERFLDAAQESGAEFRWGQRGVSIRIRCRLWPQPISVAWLYPPLRAGRGWRKTRDFSFGTAILDDVPASEKELRAVLQEWVDDLGDYAFTENVSSKGADAWYSPHDTPAEHIKLLSNRLSKVLRELKGL